MAIAKRNDVDPKQGTSEYGDVTFADEKNKKYPLDTDAHIKSAWNYIHQEKNAAEYSADDVDAIKKRIVSVWKEKIDKAGPPEMQTNKKISNSTNDALGRVYEDFNETMNPHTQIYAEPTMGPYIVDVFLNDSYVIACVDEIFYKINFSLAESGEYQFDNKGTWEPMEKSWTPAAGKMSNVRAIKTSDGAAWELDILGVPFGGPFGGRDADGQFFSVNSKTHVDMYPVVPIFYYHGFDANGIPQGEPVVVGKATWNKQDERGHWYKGVLDKTKELAQRLWDAAVAKKARASSGTIEHLVRCNEDGEITNWPVVEMTLTDERPGIFHAANSYAVALPAAKVAFEHNGLSLVIPVDEADDAQTTATSIAQPAEAAQTVWNKSEADSAVNIQPPIGALKMSDENVVTPDVLQRIKKEAVDEAIKAFKASAPAPDTAGHADHIEVVVDEADRPFRTLAEQARAVKMAKVSDGRNVDPRLVRINANAMKAAQGASESVPADGGYLLEPTIGKELILPIHEEGPFSGKVRRLPVGTNSNFGYINGVDETSRVTGSRWGGVQGYRMAEAGSLTAKRPKFRRINWELKKYAVLMYATDELILDSAQFSEVARVSAGEELAFMVNDDIVNGPGTGGPLGILNSGALVSFARVDANKVQHADILAMWQRMLPRFRKNAEWFIHSDVEAQLNALYFTGTTSVLSPYVTYGMDGVLRIMGKPVNVTEFNQTLGTQGDILLANLDEYLFWEKDEVQAATSIHIAFLTDEQAFRFIYRCDGQTTYSSPITPYRGSNTQSAFVALTAAS